MTLTSSAEVIADSISPDGNRLTTMVVTFHRFVLAEFNTHRMFSRSSASSRAIPVERVLGRVIDNPAFPVELPAEQPGMQGGSALNDTDWEDAQALLTSAHGAVTELVGDYLAAHPEKSSRLHKSVINRLLEPFGWHTVIVASTEWENFFNQRCSPLAQPEIRVAAELMQKAYEASVPSLVSYDQWHAPYVRLEDSDLTRDQLLGCSVARCARVSYENHEGIRSIDDDLGLFLRLVTADPMHAAPLEMVATPSFDGEEVLGNFKGWHQLRHQPGRIDKIQASIPELVSL